MNSQYFQWNDCPHAPFEKLHYMVRTKSQNAHKISFRFSWLLFRSVLWYFFLCTRIFWPPMRTLPLGHPWIRGIIPYLVAVETVNCFTRRSTMESSVVSSLPDHAFTPTLESMGWNDQLWDILAKFVGIAPHVSHIVDCSTPCIRAWGWRHGRVRKTQRYFPWRTVV